MASELIERDLYNGLYHMIHNPSARGRAPRYKVASKGVNTIPKGVTTIMGQTLAKDFIGWAVDACCDYLRTKLPIITEEDIKVGANEHNRLRDAGGSTGSEAHALVENFLKGLTVNESKTASIEAINAYQAFVQWFESEDPEVINVEEVIYSPTYKFAGTYDCMLEIDDKVHLCDLKTTNPSRKAPDGIYAENFIQLGGYALAHEEQRKYEEANGGTELVEIEDLTVISAKKNGVLDVKSASELDLSVQDCIGMFKRVVNLYMFLNQITQDLGGK